MTKKLNAQDHQQQRRPVASIALTTGGLIAVGTLVALWVVSRDSGAPGVDAAVVAAIPAQARAVAERHFIFEGFDSSAANQESAARGAALSGMSIAAYGQ
ncbi:hypothetical protein [Variovorax terrae]|uniref:Uncharacterized protein n=1 Tax=Variovorax terrae TaxID=2923278 RepID=A0A9X1VV25_9BURK|nr:hypothetical protein [Variovorax terrae]MCJ0763485.1 hypothetical protein [Variovorax terrae]